jgi:hypothetical protein
LKPLVVALGLSALLAAAPRAYAYRPFDGTDADVAEKGTIELELGPVGYYARASHHYLVAPATVFNYGLVDRVELVLQGFDFIDIDRGSPGPRARLLETGLFAKVVLRKGCLQHMSGVSVATEIGPLLPTVNDQTTVGAAVGGIATQCWGDVFAAHYNVAANYSLAHNVDLFGGAIFEGPASLRVRPVAEFFVEHEFNVATTYSALVGAIWRAHDAVDLDVGLRAARINSDGGGEVRLGLTWRFL